MITAGMSRLQIELCDFLPQLPLAKIGETHERLSPLLPFSPRRQELVGRGRLEECLDLGQGTMHLDPPSLGENKFCFIFLPPFGT